MYVESLEEAAALAREAGARACWKQWVGLGSYALPIEEPRAGAIVDLEALVLASLAMHRFDRRLLDFVGWWANTAARLVSLQRLRSVAKWYPGERGKELVGWFAAVAYESGDRRWKRLVGDREFQVRSGKGPERLDLADSVTLQVRLRAGIGVGARADLLALLIGLRGRSATARQIAEATSYTGTAIRTAAGDMVLGRLIQELRGRPAEYYVSASRWSELLELTALEGPEAGKPDVPQWRYWAQLFPFFDDVSRWAEQAGTDTQASDRLLASRARDLIERHRRAFELNGIAVPVLSDYKGARFLLAFRDTTRAVADWVERHL